MVGVANVTIHELSNGNDDVYRLWYDAYRFIKGQNVTLEMSLQPLQTLGMSLTVDGAAIDLTSNNSGSLTVNKLNYLHTREYVLFG